MFSRHCLKISNYTRIILPKIRNQNLKLQSFSNKCCKYRCFSGSVLSEHAMDDVQKGILKSKENDIVESQSTDPPIHEIQNQVIISKPQKERPSFNTTSSDYLLEKFMAGLSSSIHLKHRVYRNDFIKVLNIISQGNFSTEKQGLLLLRCCADYLVDESDETRIKLSEQVWSTLKPHTTFKTEHYNQMLKVYIANNRTVNVSSFIQLMQPCKPNVTTFELFLRILGESGKIDQAKEVLFNMKAEGFPATEHVFNSFIIAHGKTGNLNEMQDILSMMKSLQLKKTIDTCVALCRAYAHNKKKDLLLNELVVSQKHGFNFEEKHIVDIIKTLARVKEYSAVPQVLNFLPNESAKSPSISPYLQSACTWFVFQNYALVALEIYKCLPLPSFGPKDDTALHGRSLVRDCVKASIPISELNIITDELMSSGRNPVAIQNACEAALKLGREPLALDLFTRMKDQGLPLRPHYFWPIFILNSKTYGQKGIMKTISTMLSMEVAPDYDTIMDYILPNVSFTSPQNLVKKLQDLGLSVSSILTPMMQVLLSSGQIRAASELCTLFHSKIDIQKLMKPLIKGYQQSHDSDAVIEILNHASSKMQKPTDLSGQFLSVLLNTKSTDCLLHFDKILKAYKKKNVKISTPATDLCLIRLAQKCEPKEIERYKASLLAILDGELIVNDSDLSSDPLTHQNCMDEPGLRAHLSELEAKGMNTRGVLRKLLQEYARLGDVKAAMSIIDKCEKEQVFCSPGMRACIVDMHVRAGDVVTARKVLADLKQQFPKFVLDEFKVLDIATMFIMQNMVAEATKFIEEESEKRRVNGGRAVERNCFKLLDAMANCGSPKQTGKMLDLLLRYGYCKPTNVLLGPLVRAHLKDDNLKAATEEFVFLAKKYNKTPLKHELLCKILLRMGDGKSEDSFTYLEQFTEKLNKLAQLVLNADKSVHGASNVQLTLIAALADVGYKKTLTSLLHDSSMRVHPDAMMRLCQWFAKEKKEHVLLLLADCLKSQRVVDVSTIYELVLGIHQREDNCDKALKLWASMQDNDIVPSSKFVKNLCSLLQANNKDIPIDIALQKDDSKHSNHS